MWQLRNLFLLYLNSNTHTSMHKTFFHIHKGVSVEITGCIILSKDLQYDRRFEGGCDENQRVGKFPRTRKGGLRWLAFWFLGKRHCGLYLYQENYINHVLLTYSNQTFSLTNHSSKASWIPNHKWESQCTVNGSNNKTNLSLQWIIDPASVAGQPLSAHWALWSPVSQYKNTIRPLRVELVMRLIARPA